MDKPCNRGYVRSAKTHRCARKPCRKGVQTRDRKTKKCRTKRRTGPKKSSKKARKTSRKTSKKSKKSKKAKKSKKSKKSKKMTGGDE